MSPPAIVAHPETAATATQTARNLIFRIIASSFVVLRAVSNAASLIPDLAGWRLRNSADVDTPSKEFDVLGRLYRSIARLVSVCPRFVALSAVALSGSLLESSTRFAVTRIRVGCWDEPGAWVEDVVNSALTGGFVAGSIAKLPEPSDRCIDRSGRALDVGAAAARAMAFSADLARTVLEPYRRGRCVHHVSYVVPMRAPDTGFSLSQSLMRAAWR